MQFIFNWLISDIEMIHFCMVHNEISIRQLTILTCTDKADQEMTETDLLKKKKEK